CPRRARSRRPPRLRASRCPRELALRVAEEPDDRRAVVDAREHRLARHRAPEAAVIGRGTVVAEHEVVAGGDRDRRGVVAVVLDVARRRVRLTKWAAVTDDAALLHAQMVAGEPDDALDEVDVRQPRRRLRAHRALRGLAAAL